MPGSLLEPRVLTAKLSLPKPSFSVLTLFLLLGSSFIFLSLAASPAHAQTGPSVTVSTPNAAPGSIVSIVGIGFSSSDQYVNVSVLQGLEVWYFTAVTGTDCSRSAPGYAPPQGTYLCPANGVVETSGNVPAGDCPVTEGSFDCLFIVPALPKYANPCSTPDSCAGDELGALYADGNSNDIATTQFSVLDGMGLVPNEGSPGTTVTVYGDGWFGCFISKYGGICDITADYNWDGQYLLMDAILFKFNTNCLPVPDGDVGQAGGGSCTFSVPNNSTGIHTMTVSAYFPYGIPDKSYSADFLITPPSITASVSGSQFQVSGFGFSTSDSHVDVQIDQPGPGYYNVFLQNACVASAGAFACSIDAGMTLPPGPYFVKATGPSDIYQASTVLSVPGQYPLSFDPAAVFPGQTVKVTGYGYQYDDTAVNVYITSGAGQTETCPASQGIFSCYLTIPPNVQLGEALTIYGEGNNALDTQSGTLAVYPIVSSNPLSGPPGTAIKVNGTGFSLEDHYVTLSVQGKVLGSCSTLNTLGGFEPTGGFNSCAVTIPPLPPGTYDLLATGNGPSGDTATSLLFVGGATVSPDVVFANNLPSNVNVTGTNIGFTQYGPSGLQFVSDGVAELSDPGFTEFCPVTQGSFSCQFPTAYALEGESVGSPTIGVSGWALFPGSGCPLPGYSSHKCVQEPINYQSEPLALYDPAAVSVSCSPDPVIATPGSQTACTATVTDTAHEGTPLGSVAWTYSGPSEGQLSAASCTLAKLPPPSNQQYLIMPSACSVKLTLPQATGQIEINTTYSGASGFPNYNPATGGIVLLPLTLQSSGVGSDATAPVLNIAGTNYSVSQLPVTVWGTYGENPVAYEATVPAGTGKQYALSSFTGCGGAQLAPPLTITTQCSTVTGNYVTQYYFSSTQDSSAVSSDYSQLVPVLSSPSPASGWYNAGTQINATDSYFPIGEAFGVQDVVSSFAGSGSAPSGGSCPVPSAITSSRTHCSVLFDIDSPSSITWIWAQQYQVSLVTEGMSTDTGSATVLTVNGIGYQESQLPASVLFLSGNSLTYSYYSPIQGTSGDRYVWTGTSGLASSQTGTFTVIGPGFIDATYKTQYLQSFSASGLASDASGELVSVTVSNGQPAGTQTLGPNGGSFYADGGATITYAFQPYVGSTEAGVRYGLAGVSGPSSGFTVSSANAVTGSYVVQYLLTVQTNPEGLSPSPTPSSGYFDAGATVNVAANNVTGYVFVNWEVDGVNQTQLSETITVTMTGPHVATAAYEAPANAIQTLINIKDSMNIPNGIKVSLDAKLSAAMDSLQAGQNAIATNQLNAFINEVNAQAGKHITQQQAQVLTDFAQDIINAIES